MIARYFVAVKCLPDAYIFSPSQPKVALPIVIADYPVYSLRAGSMVVF